MSETLISGLRLSSGTTINIPVFPYNREREVIERTGGVLMVKHYDRSAATPAWETLYGLSEEDFLEFCSMTATPSPRYVTGYAYPAVNPPTIPQGVTDIYWIFCCYYAEQGDGTYKLYIATTSASGGGSLVNGGDVVYHTVTDPTTGYNTYLWFNGINPSQETFTAKCEDVAGSISFVDNVADVSISSGLPIISKSYIGEDSLELYAINIYPVDYFSTKAAAYMEFNPNANIGLVETDPDNPYTFEASTFGGGNGSWGSFDPDLADPAQIPPLPTISAANAGFISIYNPSVNQLKALSSYLWSSAFDIDSFKKLFSDPMQCIIGLSVVPVRPPLSSAKNVMFGDVDTGVSMTAIASEYVEKDCGSVDLELLYGSFMDYSPYTKIQIYLPYIGFRDLSPDDIIGGSINVTYHINVLDGGCTAYISHSSRGVLYQHSGSCIANIPLSAINYSGALQNAISAVGSIATMGVGLATGAAPVTAMGAMGLATQAANTAVNSKPSVQRSGSVSGSSGLMGIQRPFVIIERPNISVPALMNDFIGNTTNVTMKLADCEGFTMVDQIHLDNVLCTDEERNELLNLLKEGVIL